MGDLRSCFDSKGFPDSSDSKESAGSGRSPGEGNGNPFYYSCLENSMDSEAWWATVHGDTKNHTRPSHFIFFFSDSKREFLLVNHPRKPAPVPQPPIPYAGNGSTIPSAVPAKNPGVTPLFPPPDSPASPPGSIPMYPESIHVPSLFWSHYCHLSYCFTRYSHPTFIHLSE